MRPDRSPARALRLQRPPTERETASMQRLVGRMRAERTSWLTPSERAQWRLLAAVRVEQGRPDLAAACLRIANRR